MSKEYQIISSNDGNNFQKWFMDAQAIGWTPLPETFKLNGNNVYACMFVKDNAVVLKNDPSKPMHHSSCQCAQCLYE
jgi:hypothetical protein